MSNNKSIKSSPGVGLLGLTFIVFLALKLAGIGTVATWSWWLVTAPLWMPVAIALTIVLILAFVCVMIGIVRKIIHEKD
jgi:hypothetical protein